MSKENHLDVGTSPIACSAFPNFLGVFKNQRVDAGYKGRMYGAMLLSMMTEPFRWWEEVRYGNAIAKIQLPESPVFILGHWRSGTTLLHNMICQDPQFSFITTYQSVFPNQLHGSKWMFKNIMNVFLPDKRPADNVELDPDFPQEEEIALGNMIPYSFYNFWYFPHNTFNFYEKYVRFNGVPPNVRQAWITGYKKLMRSSLLYHGKSGFVSKNPPHTGRIKILLEAFPNAKFIYIYRNPIIVFLSASRFFNNTMPPIMFQHITPQQVDNIILELYKRIITDYENTKHLIPKGNLVELKYEDFETNPVNGMKHVYETINLNNHETALPYFEKYAALQKKFHKHQYKISKEKVDLILKQWGFSMEQYNYSVPEEMLLA
jgi:hypothetical protein